MGLKISEAKTPPLRKPASLFPLSSSTLTLPFSVHSLILNTSLSFIKITALPTSACSEPLWEICISVLSLLSACSKFKHAYGGRKCLWSPCAAYLWRVLLCLLFSLSISPWQLLFSLYPASFFHHLFLALFFLSLNFSLSLHLYFIFFLSPKSKIIVPHTLWVCTHGRKSRRKRKYTDAQPCIFILKCTNSSPQIGHTQHTNTHTL